MHPSEALGPRDIYGSRVVAYVIDLILVLVVAGPPPGSAGLVAALVFSFLYLGVFEGLTGYTFGRAILGAKTVKAGTTEPPGILRGVLRWLLAPIGIPILTVAVGVFNDRRRGLGDMVAQTEVLGLAPASRLRLYALFAWVAGVSVCIALSSFDTFLLIYAIYAPMVIGGLVVVLGASRLESGVVWLMVLGFTLVAACLMSFISLCERGGGRCVDVSASHKAIPAMIACALAILILFVLRGLVMRYAVMALTTAAGIIMFFRLRDVDDMTFAAFLIALFLVIGVGTEVTRFLTAREDEARAALGPPPAATA